MSSEELLAPIMPEPQIFVERTLCIIKPDAIHKSEEIEDIILRSGFTILQVTSMFPLRMPKIEFESEYHALKIL